MVILIVIQVTRFARFMNEVWRETRRLRRTLAGPVEE
jgi:hypothetical protein